MKIILLPGLDGTGKLFSDFIKAMDFPCQVICYPDDIDQKYESLQYFVESVLPVDQDFILLAESFSGPIAARIALENRRNLKGVIFVATFLRPPKPLLLFLSKLFPIKVLLKMPGVESVVDRICMGGNGSNHLRKMLFDALSHCVESTLKQRLTAIQTMADITGVIDVPCLYLQATHDYLVPSTAKNDFFKLCSNIKIESINAKHFVLQSEPAQAAIVISDWIRSNVSETK